MGRSSCSSEGSLHSLGPQTWGAPMCSSLLSPSHTGGLHGSPGDSGGLLSPAHSPSSGWNRIPEPAQCQERTEELMGSLVPHPCTSLPIPAASSCRAHNFGSIVPSMSSSTSGSVTAEQGRTQLCAVHVPPYIQCPAWKAQPKPWPAMKSVFPSQRLSPQQAGRAGMVPVAVRGQLRTAPFCSQLKPGASQHCHGP